MTLINNILYCALIITMLTIAGVMIKALFSLISGQPITFKLSNPLNLKARWPAKKDPET